MHAAIWLGRTIGHELPLLASKCFDTLYVDHSSCCDYKVIHCYSFSGVSLQCLAQIHKSRLY